MRFLPGAWRGPGRATSLVEVLISIAVLVTVLIPAYTLYVQTRSTVFQSKLAVLATLAAQDEAEDLRLLARAAGARIKDLAHDWEPVRRRKNALALLAGSTYNLTLDGSMPPELDFPEVYDRIWTKVEVGDPINNLVYPTVIHVRWQEKGERFTDADKRSRVGFSQFDVQLVRPPRGT